MFELRSLGLRGGHRSDRHGAVERHLTLAISGLRRHLHGVGPESETRRIQRQALCRSLDLKMARCLSIEETLALLQRIEAGELLAAVAEETGVLRKSL